jgi:hypothetical protein
VPERNFRQLPAKGSYMRGCSRPESSVKPSLQSTLDPGRTGGTCRAVARALGAPRPLESLVFGGASLPASVLLPAELALKANQKFAPPTSTTTARSGNGTHLDTCQFLTYLHVRPPRIDCPVHGECQLAGLRELDGVTVARYILT